jgi:hypothetical protein
MGRNRYDDKRAERDIEGSKLVKTPFPMPQFTLLPTIEYIGNQ